MNKVKEKCGEVKHTNSKRGKKYNTKHSKASLVLQEIDQQSNDNYQEKKPLCLLSALKKKVDGDCDSFKSCHEKLQYKLEAVLNGFTGQSRACHLDGDQIRKKILEDKCITKHSLQDIKLFFTDVLNLKDEESYIMYSVLALKYLRIFIDILEVTHTNHLESAIQACDLVITVLQYFIITKKLPDTEKFIVMLLHVIKQLYKKQHIDGIIIIVKNVINFLEVAAKKGTIFPEDTKKSLCMIHQMCYSLYSKELQKLIENNKLDITSIFDLRVSSLIILSFSSWKENRFIEHLSNFISRWSNILTQSCTYIKEIVQNSISHLLHSLYKLVKMECDEINESTKSLLDITWKLAHLYINFCIRNQIHHNLDQLFSTIPDKLLKTFTCFSESMTLLQKSSEISKLITQSEVKCYCICSKADMKEALSQYLSVVRSYFKTYFNQENPDTFRLFGILSLIKINSKGTTQMCGIVVNVLLELLSFVISTLLTTSISEQKNRTSSLLSHVHILFLQINLHLFSDGVDSLLCYKKNNNTRSVFEVLYNDHLTVLQKFFTKQNMMNQDDLKWLGVLLYKIGIHYYSLKKFKLALPNLQFSVFLCEHYDKDNQLDMNCMKEFIAKYNTLAECQYKLDNLKLSYETRLKLIKHFGRLTPEHLLENKSMLETQVTYWAKKKLQLAAEDKDSSTLSTRCLFDEINDKGKIFLTLVLEYEYYAYKKWSNNFNVQSLLKRIIELRKNIHEQEGDLLKYALCMIEISTLQSFNREERYHWCTEAISLLEGLNDELNGTGDELEWHIRDVLAVSYFQRSVIQYEEKVVESMQNIDRDVIELVVECTDIDTNGKRESYDSHLLKEDYINKQFIASMDTAVELWAEVLEEAIKDNPEGNSSIFFDAEESAKCLYHAAVLYSLLSQNLNSVKASYLSGLIYQILSLSTDSNVFKEQQVVSWALTASQFLFIENVPSGEEILQRLQDTQSCSIFSTLHIDVLKAAYLLYNGEIQSSAESFNQILNNEVLNDNTKSSLGIKSDIYFLLSYLKLFPLKEEKGELIIPHDQHFPLKSPFPPISDCLRYLRSLYSKYVEEPGTEGGEVNLSSSWAYLDKLLICLTRNAELLKHQGSILEAKGLLKEALLLTRKFHLSFRTLDILQQIASMNLILNNETSFNETFGTVTKILESSVDGCFHETELFAPNFVLHDLHCSCNYCIYPKLQEIHICLFLQYVESKHQFNPNFYEYDAHIGVIDTMVENAYQRYNISLGEVSRMMGISLQSSIQIEKSCKQVHQKSSNRNTKSTLSKQNNKTMIKKNQNNQDKQLFNIFSRYSFEAKLNQSIKDNKNMIKTVEQLISKTEISNSFEHTQHEYHRLVAQLYCLRSLLYVGGDIAENSWFSKNEGMINNINTARQCSKVVPKVSSKKKVLLAVSKESNLITDETPQPVRKVTRKGRLIKKIRYKDNEQTLLPNSKSNQIRDSKAEYNLITDETPQPVRKVNRNGKYVKKGRLKDNEKTSKLNSKSKQIQNYNCSSELSIIKCLEDLQKSLSVLNPYTDTLIIKAIYQLMLLLSGMSNKGLTIACQLLSSSRTLHQQILSSYGKKLRERKTLKALVQGKEEQILQTTSDLLERYSDPKLVLNHGSMQELVKDYIPEDWCVCSLSLAEVENKRYLIVCRLEALRESSVMKINLSEKSKCNTWKPHVVCDLASAFDDDLLEKFNNLIDESQESMKIKDKKAWWAERVRLDKQLKSSIMRLENEWLQGWKGLLIGQYDDIEKEDNLNLLANDIADEISSTIKADPERGLIKCLADGFGYCTKYQILDSLQTLFGEQYSETVYEIFLQHLQENRKGRTKEDMASGESTSNAVSSNRKPVVLILDKTLQKLPWESMSIFQDQTVTRMPSLLMTSSHCRNYQDAIAHGVALEKCCYILNPKNDLKHTEEKFSDWFQSEGWHGIVGRPPTQTEYSDAISNNDLFIYCGHGSGQEYLGWSAVHRLQSSAVSLLMGCSSGKLLVQGELEAQGMVQYYLSAGCPAVVANLWHVTDKDIDLFLEKLLKLWLTEERGTNLAECVAKARHACKLEYLNGAAPVVYGLPLSVKEV